MSSPGRNIPAGLARKIKEEAGYRCAIPTCRGTSGLEMAHIVPWAKVKEHSFDNLILLCAVCHIRFDRGEIPAASVRQYKANLGLLSHRYTQMELRLLSAFVGKGSGTMIHLAVDPFFFLSLCTEGLVSAAGYGRVTTMGPNSPEIRAAYVYKLTEQGTRFVETMATAGNLEAL
ncbi:HNH endonuclease signature motif containing protein [Arthrobacter sp. NPDC093125]|uniref:HNH endonuclease signature motif containing protein n=1 Tax=Arthrobacter sp. NPDC093125 TaxID=3363944 RepID=UPI003801E284